jgi:hypothetical protein
MPDATGSGIVPCLVMGFALRCLVADLIGLTSVFGSEYKSETETEMDVRTAGNSGI